MTQFGFFDLEYRLDKIDKNGDPLKNSISSSIGKASVHDSNVFEELLDSENSRRAQWADSTYRSGYKPYFSRFPKILP